MPAEGIRNFRCTIEYSPISFCDQHASVNFSKWIEYLFFLLWLLVSKRPVCSTLQGFCFMLQMIALVSSEQNTDNISYFNCPWKAMCLTAIWWSKLIIVSNYVVVIIIFCAIQISCISTSSARNRVQLLGKKIPLTKRSHEAAADMQVSHTSLWLVS